jgi:hypothetical protein
MGIFQGIAFAFIWNERRGTANLFFCANGIAGRFGRHPLCLAGNRTRRRLSCCRRHRRHREPETSPLNGEVSWEVSVSVGAERRLWPEVATGKRTYRRIGVRPSACRGCEPGGRHTGLSQPRVNSGLSFLAPSASEARDKSLG